MAITNGAIHCLTVQLVNLLLVVLTRWISKNIPYYIPLFLLEAGENVGSIAPVFYLDFGEILPETVSVMRWPASRIGDAQTYSTDFEMVNTELEGDTFSLFPLGDGDYVYEVSANWGDVGGASYTFRTLPQIRGNTDG